MTVIANAGALVDAGAGSVAFRAGQIVEQLLLDRAADRATSAGVSIVTVEHVFQCIDDRLLDQLRTQLDERARRCSREAA